MAHGVLAIALVILLLVFTVGIHQRRQDKLELTKLRKEIKELHLETITLKQLIAKYARRTRSQSGSSPKSDN